MMLPRRLESPLPPAVVVLLGTPERLLPLAMLLAPRLPRRRHFLATAALLEWGGRCSSRMDQHTIPGRGNPAIPRVRDRQAVKHTSTSLGAGEPFGILVIDMTCGDKDNILKVNRTTFPQKNEQPAKISPDHSGLIFCPCHRLCHTNATARTLSFLYRAPLCYT